MMKQLKDYEIDTIELNLKIIESQIERYMNDVDAIKHIQVSIDDIREVIYGRENNARNLHY